MRNLTYLLIAAAAVACTTVPAHAEVLCRNIERVEIYSNQEEPPSIDNGFDETGKAHLIWNDLDLLDSYTVKCFTTTDAEAPVTEKTFSGNVPATCEQQNGELACH